MAAAETRIICAAAELQDGGRAWRFEIAQADGVPPLPAFAVRYRGKVYAYVNACRHIPVELDLRDGEVFDLSGHYLVCSMHGACYEAHTGYCVSGPCRGQRLIAVPVFEQDGNICINVMPS